MSKRLPSTSTYPSFNDNDAHKLISYIYELDVDDDYLIDWTAVASLFDHKYNPGWLRCKFQALSKEVRSSHLLEFVDVVEQLYSIYEEKLRPCVSNPSEQMSTVETHTIDNNGIECTDSYAGTITNDTDVIVID